MHEYLCYIFFFPSEIILSLLCMRIIYERALLVWSLTIFLCSEILYDWKRQKQNILEGLKD